jgi:hypothetical protein
MYMMAPLGEHYDLGFGAVGDAFREAAESLRKANSDQATYLWAHLPETYLLRHSIELYLKAGTIVMHRCLRLPYGTEPYDTKAPKVLGSKGDWLSLFGTHNLPLLYHYWKKLLTENKDRLLALASGNPDMNIPIELDGWIETIGEIDPNGDYLRFPVSKGNVDDNQKSPFKEVSRESLFPLGENKEYVRALVVKSADGEIVQVFKHDSDTHKDVAEAVWNAANELSGFQAMMRFELTGGR